MLHLLQIISCQIELHSPPTPPGLCSQSFATLMDGGCEEFQFRAGLKVWIFLLWTPGARCLSDSGRIAQITASPPAWFLGLDRVEGESGTLRLRERSLIICLTASHVASWNTLCYLARHFGPATLKIASFLDSMLTLFGFTSNSPVGPETLSWFQFCFRTRSGALDKQTRSFDECISFVSCGGAARRGGQDKQRRRNLKDHLLRELAPRAFA